ncbi:MAG: hypothetical protein ACLFQY_18380, partial [Desulfococcaceae bacterium]
KLYRDHSSSILRVSILVWNSQGYCLDVLSPERIILKFSEKKAISKISPKAVLSFLLANPAPDPL